jgi:hypothetical protein
MKKLINIALFLLLFWPLASLAHPGRTDAYGCHTCRTNCPSWGLDYDEYHCHNTKALPQPEEPIKSTYGAGGTGYTDPAPEYKKPAPIENNINPNVNINSETNSNKNNFLNQKVLGTEYNEPSSKEDDNNWLGWIIGLGAAGAGGYWLTKKK